MSERPLNDWAGFYASCRHTCAPSTPFRYHLSRIYHSKTPEAAISPAWQSSQQTTPQSPSFCVLNFRCAWQLCLFPGLKPDSGLNLIGCLIDNLKCAVVEFWQLSAGSSSLWKIREVTCLKQASDELFQRSNVIFCCWILTCFCRWLQLWKERVYDNWETLAVSAMRESSSEKVF